MLPGLVADGVATLGVRQFANPAVAARFAAGRLGVSGAIYIDSSDMKSDTKAGGGDLLYQAAMTYAHNNGKRFIPDPSSVSAIAWVRRLGHMLSSALRHGTTQHLQPFREGLDEVPRSQWRMDDTPEAFAANVALLAHIETEAIQKAAAARDIDISQLRYDAESDTILDGSGRSLREGDVENLVSRLDPGDSGVGETALLRFVVSQTQLAGHEPGRSAEQRDRSSHIGAGERATQMGGDEILPDDPIFHLLKPTTDERKRQLLYSLPSGQVNADGGLSPEARSQQARAELDRLRQSAPDLAQSIRLVRNRDELRESDYHPEDWEKLARGEGFYDDRDGTAVILTDHVELQDGETMADGIARVALHERFGHAGIAQLRKTDKRFDGRWDQLAKQLESDTAIRQELSAIRQEKGYEELAGDAAALAEEWFSRRVGKMTLAELAALQPNTLLGQMWQTLKDAIARLTGRFDQSEWLNRQVRDILIRNREALGRKKP